MLSCLTSINSEARDGWDGLVLRVVEENDIGFSDRHYTQGLYLSAALPDGMGPAGPADWLPKIQFIPGVYKWGVALGQVIATPEDTSQRELIKGDRPYAGYLFFRPFLQRRGVTPEWNVPLRETFSVSLGLVGPESQADVAQIRVHEWVDSPQPRGWRHQLRNEPIVNLGYKREFLFGTSVSGWNAQWLPWLGFDAGNALVAARGGWLIRAGYNIPDDFSTEPSGRGRWAHGFYLFAGMEGRLVGHNIFLDGNTFTSSHSVEKKILTWDGVFGGTLALGQVELTFAHTVRGPEFVNQDHLDQFTSLSLTAKF